MQENDNSIKKIIPSLIKNIITNLLYIIAGKFLRATTFTVLQIFHTNEKLFCKIRESLVPRKFLAIQQSSIKVENLWNLNDSILPENFKMRRINAGLIEGHC